MEENPAAPLSFFQRLTTQKKIVFAGAGLLIGVAYIALNIGIWTYARTSGKAAQTVANKNGSAPAGEESLQPEGQIATPPPTGGPTPTPTPRPIGPGQYACSPIGTCKDYADDVRKEKCTVTYADSLCLDQCADPTKQCKN
ncbi:hypothetical protein MUP56_01935 [Patescibacteria group bacterium]|nr:hypothetical protein [Patescibacteria group bacterium]